MAGLADRADCLRKARNRMMRRHVTCLEMNLGGAAVIAGDEAIKDFGEEPPFLSSEPSHDAEIDRNQLAGVVDEQISRMHIGVKESIAQGVPKKGLNDRPVKPPQIEPLGLEPVAIRQANLINPFQREHIACGS